MFSLTDGEGGEEVGAESVRVEGKSVIDEGRAEILENRSGKGCDSS